jgi:ribosomal subunit interface protein
VPLKTGHEGSSYVDIIFNARHTEVLEKFRTLAIAKLARIEKLDSKAIRVDVEVLEEHNPRLSDQKERVELTLISRGPKIRAEAAADDRLAALDMALAKLESRVRRACDRRKDRHGAHGAVRLGDMPEADLASDAELPAIRLADRADALAAPAGPEDLVAVAEGDSPLVVREKFHSAAPMSLDQALFEMEMVGHDFFLFTDAAVGLPSVVYRRRGYQYGVIRLVQERAVPPPGGDPSANGQVVARKRVAANGTASDTSSAPSTSQASADASEAASRAGQAPSGRKVRRGTRPAHH